MTDWSKEFRRATVAGVPFWVMDDEAAPGRRVVVHDISGGENPVTEDMGRKSDVFYQMAYVTGDDVVAQGRALEAAANIPGPVSLTLPMDPARMVHFELCERARSRDENGKIAYSLTFLEYGAGGASVALPDAQMREAFAAGFDAVLGEIAGAF